MTVTECSLSALPHRVQEDDIHEGYYIPKGALVIANIRSVFSMDIHEVQPVQILLHSSRHMLNDPRTYPNPSEFNPDRYIGGEGREPQQDPRAISFGFGRRICPGLNLADASIFISCAMSLAVFDISKTVENGVEITPVVDNTPGTIR